MAKVRTATAMVGLALCAACSTRAVTGALGGRITPGSFSDIAAAAKPAVVHVAAVKAMDPAEGTLPRPVGPRAPTIPPDLVRKSLGSGFFISADGLVVTNRHVVADAEEIVVRLAATSPDAHGPEFPARLIGADPATDLALLKIEPAGETPSLRLGDSNRVEVGDWVLAVGNPFGLEQTVTAGIVSSTTRAVGEEPTGGFIQTDAPINPGNSGGPLLNLDGEVVGVNLAIVSSGSGSVGIGFATPSNMAEPVVEELRRQGRVVRGWIGLETQDLTGDLAAAFRVPEHGGVLVAEVDSRGPAAGAGLRRGDVILDVGGKASASSRELASQVNATKLGDAIEIRFARGGREGTTKVFVSEEPALAAIDGASRKISRDGLGVVVEPVTPELSQEIGMELEAGLFVDSVVPGGLADKAGLLVGDVIQEINGERIADVESLKRAIEAAPAGQPVLIVVQRGESSRYLAAKKD